MERNVALFVGTIIVALGCVTIYQVSESQDREAADRGAQARAWHARNKTTKAGLLCEKHAGWTPEACDAIAGAKVQMGMTKEQVKLAWGKPRGMNETVAAGVDREQWVYPSDYLYFDHGVLTSIQTSR